jgi:ATP-dependent DNA ligase
VNYTGYYLYPPRPRQAITVNQLPGVERRGYWAQVKKHGTSNLIIVDPDNGSSRDRRLGASARTVRCYNRHGGEHKAWQLTEASVRQFRRLAGAGYYVFTAELLHSKVHGIRDTNFVYDILVHNGDYLVGRTFAERQEILKSVFLRGRTPTPTYSHYTLDDNTWLAVNHTKGLQTVFTSLTKNEDEGLVLKDPKARLRLCGRPNNNSEWQVKCRRNDFSPNFSA